MSSSSGSYTTPDSPGGSGGPPDSSNKYKGIRRRKWGKWVSEIRVPGTSQRLWLGSYTTPEAAAVAHDVAFYCLRGNSSPKNLNFPDLMLPAGARVGLSPRSVQQAASDAGLAVDARYLESKKDLREVEQSPPEDEAAGRLWQQDGGATTDYWRRNDEYQNISVDDYL